MEVLQQYLPITNLVLAICIVFHLICEFTHYVHSYFSSKRDKNLLEKLNDRLERLEEVHKECRDGCSAKKTKSSALIIKT